MATEKIVRSDLSGELVSDGKVARITVRLSDSTTFVLDASDDEAISFSVESGARQQKARGRKPAEAAAAAPAEQESASVKAA